MFGPKIPCQTVSRRVCVTLASSHHGWPIQIFLMPLRLLHPLKLGSKCTKYCAGCAVNEPVHRTTQGQSNCSRLDLYLVTECIQEMSLMIGKCRKFLHQCYGPCFFKIASRWIVHTWSLQCYKLLWLKCLQFLQWYRCSCGDLGSLVNMKDAGDISPYTRQPSDQGRQTFMWDL